MGHIEGTTPNPLALLIEAYNGSGQQERTDIRRIRKLLTTSDQPWDRSTRLHVTASALVVHQPSQTVLLRWHQRQQSWLQVGGHGKPGEVDPFVVAMREAAEETGLDDLTVGPTGPIPVHVAIVPVAESLTEPAHEHADIRYMFVTEEPERVRPENEEARLRWLSFPGAELATSEANVRETLRRVANEVTDSD